jgi:hypothetical protein
LAWIEGFLIGIKIAVFVIAQTSHEGRPGRSDAALSLARSGGSVEFWFANA